MKLIKKIIVSSLVAASMLAASATTFAAEGDAKVAKALNDTIAILQTTAELVESGAAQDAITQSLHEAKQAQKEFRYEQTERKRQYAADHIKEALSANKKSDKATTLTEVKAALAGFQEMKPIYDAAH